MPRVNFDQAAGLILSTGPAPSFFVSRTATCPGTLAISTQLPPCPVLYDDFRQLLAKISPDGLHECY